MEIKHITDHDSPQSYFWGRKQTKIILAGNMSLRTNKNSAFLQVTVVALLVLAVLSLGPNDGEDLARRGWFHSISIFITKNEKF